MTPDERWKAFEGLFTKGLFKDPEIAYGFMMHVRAAYEDGVADGREAAEATGHPGSARAAG